MQFQEVQPRSNSAARANEDLRPLKILLFCLELGCSLACAAYSGASYVLSPALPVQLWLCCTWTPSLCLFQLNSMYATSVLCAWSHSALSKLLSIFIDADAGAEKSFNTYTSEQCSLERCSDVFDTYNIDYDPRTAKPVAEQLAKCLPIWHSAKLDVKNPLGQQRRSRKEQEAKQTSGCSLKTCRKAACCHKWSLKGTFACRHTIVNSKTVYVIPWQHEKHITACQWTAV